jgi:hypothetical protein
MVSRVRSRVDGNDHLPHERFSQFNDEHSELGETMPNLLEVPAVGANSISEGMFRPANHVATQPEQS